MHTEKLNEFNFLKEDVANKAKVWIVKKGDWYI